MLEYISLSTCRREFLVTYFDETLHEKNPICCDNDGATLSTKKSEVENIATVLPWKKYFKKFLKMI